jgi:glycosyltransferase involved in cell wall biosynthesis
MPEKNLIFSYGVNDPEKDVILGKLRNWLYKRTAAVLQTMGVWGDGTVWAELKSENWWAQAMRSEFTSPSAPLVSFGDESTKIQQNGRFQSTLEWQNNCESFPYYPNILAIQSPDDPELIKLISESVATIYIPVDEDFGMTPVESMACGVPVIWVNDGWLKESVLDGKTGILIWKEANIDDLCTAVNSLTLEKSLTMKWDCIERAGKFGLDEFSKIVRKQLS